jgi:DNA-binding NarL/FixJ family response regulator
MSDARVLLVDDHELVRDGIRVMLEPAGDIEVVGEAGSGEEAVALTESLHPNVVLMDVKMPRMDGIAATREIKARFPEVNVIIVTYGDDEYLVPAIEAGATGYLSKVVSREDLAQAIRSVESGQSYVDPSLSRGLFDQLSALARGQRDSRAMLSERELRVLHMIASGATNKEIAVELQLSDSSIKRDVRIIFEKLRVADRSEAVAEAYRRKFI